jgi:hypothetical protein
VPWIEQAYITLLVLRAGLTRGRRQFFLYVGIVSHLLACFFFLWPTLFVCPEDPAMSEDPATPFISDTCLQGSWRQAYGLDPQPMGCSESPEVDCIVDGMAPNRQYIDALYWSLTTMTTIGYGDRGPQTKDEILFVMFAEVFGLAFFALLLTQINNVNDVLGETTQEKNDEKNAVVRFLKDNHLGDVLIDQVVRFLNFRSSVLAGNSYSDDDDRFASLSPFLKRQIQIALYRPVLKRVPLFGWNEDDLAEDEMLRNLFIEIDSDGGGELELLEIEQLMTMLELGLTPGQIKACFNEMDIEATGSIDFSEFRRW